MHAVDTNILVRLLVADDAVQTASARRVIGSSSVFVSKTVLVELEWVLRTTYSYSRTAVGGAIDILLATANVEIEDEAAVRRAFGWFRQGMDFADALHLASCGGSDAFVTFDTSMRRRATTLATKPPVIAP